MVREFRTLPETATLQEAVDALLATSQHDFPVLDENGNVAGILTRHDLDRARCAKMIRTFESVM